jgi:hypothetical protein
MDRQGMFVSGFLQVLNFRIEAPVGATPGSSEINRHDSSLLPDGFL